MSGPARFLPRTGRRRGAFAVVLLAGLACAGSVGTPAARAEATEARASSAAAFPAEAVDLARTLVVQDEGRVKPFSTFADYALLKFNHRRSVADPARARDLHATEWLLEVLLRPERAAAVPCFLVEDAEILDAVGYEAAEGGAKHRRDRYSFTELAPYVRALGQRADAARTVPGGERDRVQAGLIALDEDLRRYLALLRFLDFARADFAVPEAARVAALFPGRERVPFAEVLARHADLVGLAGDGSPPDPDASPEEKDARAGAFALLEAAEAVAGRARVLAVAPTVDGSAAWATPYDVMAAALGGAAPRAQTDVVAAWAEMSRTADDPAAFLAAVRTTHERTRRLVEARGEYGKIRLEALLYAVAPFGWARGLYLLAFVLAVAAAFRGTRWLRAATWGALGAAFALHAGGVVVRCILRERPPISTLYETVLFVSGAGVLALGVAEAIQRKGIAFVLAPVVGSLGLFLAARYEAMKGEDTMPMLQAVLDTNFWLATHVTCISLGYCGTLLSTAVGYAYVLGRAFGFRRGDDAFYRDVHRLNYGTLCFGLLFAVVGTILGGVWANESWGRFWGWDPKENGALLICLALLAILHARMGGFLKAHGFAMASVFAGAVVAFSWWHTNLLGIGLHAYGFTSGIHDGLMVFYGVEGGVLLLGFVSQAVRGARLRGA